jgi:hypothetical protein
VTLVKAFRRRSTSTHHCLTAEQQIQQYSSQIASNTLLTPKETFKDGRRAGENATLVGSTGRGKRGQARREEGARLRAKEEERENNQHSLADSNRGIEEE